MRTKSRHILFVAALVGITGFVLWLTSSRDSTRIRSHFGIRLPSDTKVVARQIDKFGFDGSVAWEVILNSKTDSLGLVPEGFIELSATHDPWSNYQEILEHLRGTLPKAFSDFGATKVFVGGPHGNSFVGISEPRDRIIMFRFWT